MVIDSHQHFWHYEPIKHGWIDDEMAGIRRDYLPSDLKKEYQENGVDGCVAVQADQTLSETDFLVQLSNENDFIKGVVGWVDLRSETVQKDLESYHSFSKLKGFRHVVQGEPDHNFLLRADFLRGISALGVFNYTYDILIFPHQLGATLEFVKHFPNQRFVIDHIAKPYIKDGYFDGWSVIMQEISKHQNVFCKLSGMITEADYGSWTSEQLKPYMDLILNAFGTQRIMFGSDWPVCLVAGSYNQVKGIVSDFISDFSSHEQNDIMGNNAIKFYDLEE